MRALTVAPGIANSARVEDVPEPPRSDGAVLVRTLALGVCGTDREIVSGSYGWAPPGEKRLVIGHESLGEVCEAPADSGFRPGDRVVGIVRRPDPVPCPACAVGEWDMCRNGRYTERGIKERNGYGADYFRVEADFLVKVDPTLGDAGVLVEPTSVVAKAWDHTERIGRRSRSWQPQTLLVTGAGPIGLLAALLGTQRGLDVHVLDHHDSAAKRAIVHEIGGTFHLEKLTDTLKPDILMECTGAPSVVRDALGRTAPGGIVCLVGVSSPGHDLDIDVGSLNRTMVLDNDTVFGSVNANRTHYEGAVAALERADKAWLARLITRRVPVEQWTQSLEPQPDDIKVVVDFSPTPTPPPHAGRGREGMMSTRIEDYALIGDCKSAALVARNGSIDWLCWPRFDSEACFAALLGSPDHGRWLVAPQQQARVTRRYRPNTLILETHFETADGAATLVDFMPFGSEHSEIVRLVVGTRGKLKMHTELVLRFGYGAVVPWVTRVEDGALRAIAGPDMAVLRTPVHVKGKDMTTVGEFVIGEGETIPFVLTYSPSHKTLPESLDPTTALQATEKFWTEWSAKCRPAGAWSEAVRRSVITLKALTYGPTGGIVAAPTTSLPERIGGKRNWDYRYCWLRDATLTLLTVMHAGYYEEAQSWREWLLRAVAGSPEQLQIMYGIGGERRLIEWVADWLPGYEQSAPVRIGNAAYTQRQLDVFGEAMDVHYQARRCGLATHQSGWDIQLKFLEHLTKIWREPDQGIWEMRGPAQHFTYSKAMAWVAFDRGIKSIETFGLDGPLDDWLKLRDEIHEDVCEHSFDKTLGTFVQAYGSNQLDANLLLLPCIGFLPVTDRRIADTIAAIERHLVCDGFVMRYSTEQVEDALPPGEGAFLACSFWLVDVYVLQERYDDAERLFRRLVGLCNDVGLLSEEYDPRAKRLAGNFPQAFSHLALINSAYNLTRERKPVQQRAEDTMAPPKEIAAAD